MVKLRIPALCSVAYGRLRRRNLRLRIDLRGVRSADYARSNGGSNHRLKSIQTMLVPESCCRMCKRAGWLLGSACNISRSVRHLAKLHSRMPNALWSRNSFSLLCRRGKARSWMADWSNKYCKHWSCDVHCSFQMVHESESLSAEALVLQTSLDVNSHPPRPLGDQDIRSCSPRLGTRPREART